MTVARAWRPLTRRQLRELVRDRVPGGVSLLDPPGTRDTRTPAQLEMAHRIHLARLKSDADYRWWHEIAVAVAYAPSGHEIDDEPARDMSAVVLAPVAPRARQRARRSPRRAAAKNATSGSDGPEPPRCIVVSLPPPDPDGVRRLARLLVERAASEVLNRALGAQHSDAATASTVTASRSKVL